MRRGDASKYKDYPELRAKQPTFTAINMPKAVRKWKCDMCGKPIPVGSRYLRYIHRVPFEIDDCAYHFQCFALVNAYCIQNRKRKFVNGWVRRWALLKYCNGCKKVCKYDLSNCPKIAQKIAFKPPKYPFEEEENTNEQA